MKKFFSRYCSGDSHPAVVNFEILRFTQDEKKESKEIDAPSQVQDRDTIAELKGKKLPTCNQAG